MKVLLEIIAGVFVLAILILTYALTDVSKRCDDAEEYWRDKTK